MSLFHHLEHFVHIPPFRSTVREDLPRHPDRERQTVDHVPWGSEDIPLETATDATTQGILVQRPDGLPGGSRIDRGKDQSGCEVETQGLRESQVREAEFRGRDDGAS